MPLFLEDEDFGKLGKNLISKLGRRQRRKEQQEWGGEEAGEEVNFLKYYFLER